MYIRVYELNLLIYDNDDDGFLEYKNIFFLDIIINIFHRRISKRFLHTGWCLDFFFFFFGLDIFHKIERYCFKIVYETGTCWNEYKNGHVPSNVGIFIESIE